MFTQLFMKLNSTSDHPLKFDKETDNQTSSNQSNNKLIKIHHVLPTDTLEGICVKYGIKVN